MTNKPRIEIPKTWAGIDTREAYRKFVEEGDRTPEPEPSVNASGKNLDGFVYNPLTNLYMAKERSHLGLNWNQTHKALNSEGKRMPTIPEFRLYLKYLKENANSNPEFQDIYNEITQVREPWRSEWLDAYFEKRKDGLYVLTGNKSKAEKLEDCLMKDKTPGINLDDWVSGINTTRQGLPKQKVDDGSLYYWYPRSGGVAWFNANSDGASLGCLGDPGDTYSSLGVFAAVENGEARGQKQGGGK